MLKQFIPFSALLLSVLTTFSQDTSQWHTKVSDGYTYRYVSKDPMAARFYQLKNGLTVILSPNHAEPRISARIAVRTGSNNDPADHTGLAHYLEHLLFKGTTRYGSLNWTKEKIYLDSIDDLYEHYNKITDSSARAALYRQIDQTSNRASHFAIANEYDKMMADIGSQESNAHTSVEETVYEEDFPANATDKFLAVQAERFRDPVFRLFHTELEAVYEEKNRGLDNDRSKMHEAMLRNLFPTTNYGQQSTIGTIEHLKNPSLKAIRNYYHTWYVPNNMAIILAGDFNPDQMIVRIDSAFSYMQQHPVNLYEPAPEKAMDTVVVRNIFGPSAESIRIAFRTPASTTHDALVLDLISSILSNGKAGLLDLDLNKQQIVQNAGCYLEQFKDYGALVLDGTPKQDQSLDQVRDLLFKELEKLKRGDFDEGLVKAIVANNKLALLEGLKKNDNRVESLTDEYVKSRGSDWGKDVNALDDQLRVTRKEIMETAARYIGSGYVLLYKHKGTDQHIVKVEKPPISPVETNAGSQSAFVRRIEAMPVTPFTPQFLDYEKGFVRTELGGAPLIYLQNRENDLFHLYFRFDMGKWNNPYLPLAAQYLQFLSTPQHSATEITRAFYSLACSYSVNVENETTTIVLSGLSENMQKALALFEELLGKCTADTTALAALKERISKARANAKLNKNTIMQGMINYARYGEHNPFNDVLRPEQMNALQADTLVHLLHTLENFRHTLIYYGPLSADTLKTTAGRLHILPADWQPYPAKMKFSFQSADKPAVLFTSYDMVQSEIYWVRNTDPYDPSKETVIDVFNNYFGGGMASVVFQTIRESKALAYATFAEYVSPLKKENPYFVIAYIGCQADKMHEAVAGMNQLLDTLPMAEQNFSLARQSIRKDLETERFTEDQIIFSWLAAKDLGWNQDRRRIEYEQLGSIRSADVKKFHDSEISHKPYTYCIVGSDQKLNMDDLKKMGELKILKLEEIFGY